jgi:hypothetical protein
MAPQTNVGSTSLSASGGFTMSINIPATQPPGAYDLIAVQGGNQLASTSIQVVAAGQALPTAVEVYGWPDTSSPAPVFDGTTIDLVFQGFDPGTVTVTVDSTSGTLLGTTTSPGTGMFTASFAWPGLSGTHTLYAQSSVATQLPATCEVANTPFPK